MTKMGMNILEEEEEALALLLFLRIRHAGYFCGFIKLNNPDSHPKKGN